MFMMSNFHPPEVVVRGSETPLQAGKNVIVVHMNLLHRALAGRVSRLPLV